MSEKQDSGKMSLQDGFNLSLQSHSSLKRGDNQKNEADYIEVLKGLILAKF